MGVARHRWLGALCFPVSPLKNHYMKENNSGKGKIIASVIVAIGLITAAAIISFAPSPGSNTSGVPTFDGASVADEDCLIKGNISSSGEKIYHVPSGQFYSRTKITESKGERWFCTEAEARAAGWRKSLR